MGTNSYLIGIDVGSTTVKCVVVEPESFSIVWRCYDRHEGLQGPKLLESLERMESENPFLKEGQHLAYITGSGGTAVAGHVGARFIQEVNAVTLAVERLHPDVNSVVELGGQDAKIIIFQPGANAEERRVVTSMNDKCASGTGATIDKCLLKVGLSSEQATQIPFLPEKLHHVAAKCGVFAETDVVNLVKSGVPSEEIVNSLADAIVMQNLTVLTRGNTLLSNVLLLGGPNTYLPFLQACWRKRIIDTWKERGYAIPDIPAEELIKVPDDAQYYAAFGAVVFGAQEQAEGADYCGVERLRSYLSGEGQRASSHHTGPGLWKTEEELDEFKKTYVKPAFKAQQFNREETVRVFVGIDGGSTTTKAVLLDEQGEVITKEYLLSTGNPINDSNIIFKKLKKYILQQSAPVEIAGCGVTGYAGDVLEKALGCDANIVETIAHMQSAKRFCGDDIDVVCDVGGQDIKVLFLQHGDIKSFRLSNQCSAGNGMLLQAMAQQFGVKVEQFADVAFEAKSSPNFSYGCAVFLDSDRVNFQKEGYSREELFAGLARVLPKNIWQYVVQIPRLAELGRKFVLQGGTQYNLAAVKAQVDYIKARVPNAEVIVHPYCGEGGAIGAALEAIRVVKLQGKSSFIGLDAALNVQFTTRTDEETRCNFCTNSCSRTFIDIELPIAPPVRHIAGFACEKGEVESKQEVVAQEKQRRKLKANYPNMVDEESKLVFRHVYKATLLPDASTQIETTQPEKRWFTVHHKKVKRHFQRSSEAAMQRRQQIRVGIPRALNIYTIAPFMRTYLEALGITSHNIVFSDETSEELWRDGGKYGSIDPCFPAKVSQAHIYNLLYKKQTSRKSLDYIWFPSVIQLSNFCINVIGNTTCPIVAGTPNVVKASFTKEKNLFDQCGVDYVDSALDFNHFSLLKRQLFDTWASHLDITEDESDWACEQGQKAMLHIDAKVQSRGMELLKSMEDNSRVGLLMLGRPYHNDPGINHEVLSDFQALGYPVLSIRSIPKDPAYLDQFFGEEIRSGKIEDAFDTRDVWPESYSVNSAQKVWAAKFAARHPNIAVVDFSSFKCGHDAPTYGLVNQILAASKTPHFMLHDIDANKPGGSIKIRVNTFHYSLQRFQAELDASKKSVMPPTYKPATKVS
ncbi:MAG TPA: CoA activase [Gammaproteobacteria bacterium]|nr:CoA activase [Gammaproteobacteria bacterium]